MSEFIEIPNELIEKAMAKRKDSRTRAASPQAWRRLRNQMTERELQDIADDIAQHCREVYGEQRIPVPTSLADVIAEALSDVDWEERSQA